VRNLRERNDESPLLAGLRLEGSRSEGVANSYPTAGA
jgi:hypothetical protein